MLFRLPTRSYTSFLICHLTDPTAQYWVTYAFLTVFESAVSAVYWFPFYYTFKFVLVLWMALPQTGGAQMVFRSVIQPVFSRYFQVYILSLAQKCYFANLCRATRRLPILDPRYLSTLSRGREASRADPCRPTLRLLTLDHR